MRGSPIRAIQVTAIILTLTLGLALHAAQVAAADAKDLGVYDYHACALKENGTVWCWGYNEYHQLGDGTTDDRSTPVQVQTASGALTGIRRLSPSGYDHACAITGTGRVRCWGKNDHGQLGDGSSQPRQYPVTVMRRGGGALTDVRALALGDHHSCALRDDRTVWCWGDNTYGQLGDGTTSPRLRAVQVRRGKGALTEVRAIGLGIRHSCAVRQDSKLWCWGENENGELGIGSADANAHPHPRKVKTASGRDLSGVKAVDGGNVHTCALIADGGVRCWGSDELGSLGNGTGRSSRYPMKVQRDSGFLANVSSVDVGYFHSCARTSSGGAYCWGYAGDGQLGIGPVPSGLEAHKAVRVRRDAVTMMGGVGKVRAGDSFSCLLKSNGTAWCMGWGNVGQMGNGQTIDVTPYPVQALVP